MKTIEELALESGVYDADLGAQAAKAGVMKFASLLRQQFLTRMVDDMERSLAANDARVAAAVAAEREACAKACEDADTFNYDDPGGSYAAVIRARSTAAPAGAPLPTDPPPG